MIEDTTNILGLLKASLFDAPVPAADESSLRELKVHGVAALTAPILKRLDLPEELYHDWEKTILSQVGYYCRYMNVQKTLPVTVPYIILKGTSAAQYYPHPEYRGLGDIDIMTSHEDYPLACDELLKNGFRETTSLLKKGHERHREFEKNNFEIEVHAFYGYRNHPEETKYLDDLIISHITPDHVLPDLVNGLTLLEHLNHHMEEGIGLRHVVDWMMFVNRYLTDDRWPEFRAHAQKTGHEQLALYATRMCEMYLGLPARTWCAEADEGICEQLMEYVIASGNFGMKQESDKRARMHFLYSAQMPQGMLGLLKKRGIENWDAAQRHPFLKRFAGIRQIGRCVVLGLKSKDGIRNLISDFKDSERKNRLFDTLGVAREQKGIVLYIDGKYMQANASGQVKR